MSNIPLHISMLPNVPLPEDFLRLRVPATIPSPHVSSVGNRSDTTKTHDEVNRIEDAEAKQGHSNNMTYSIVIVKETEVGSLGMTIRDSYIRRPGLGIDGSLPFQPTKEYHGDTAVVVTDFKSDQSPTRLAGVEVGDVLHSVNDHSVHTVRNAVEIIRNCPILSLLKLNFVRGIQYQLYSSDENTTTSQLKNVKSVGGKVLNESLEKDCFVYPGNRINQKGNVERPALASTTNGVKKLKRRPIHPVYHLLNRHKMLLPAHTSADQVFRFTSMLNNFQIYQENVGYTRQPLIIRILHTFKDPESKEDENSYTIWVADVYTGKEWYAPARKYSDFVELRSHLTNLRGEIGNYSLEKPRALPIFQAKTSDRERMDLLEAFLRSVCLLLYTRTSEGSEESCFLEVAFHLRSFLGCDEVVNKMSPSRSQRVGSPSKKMKVLDLHRSTQLYVYLVLNIPPFQDIISKFIKDRRSSAEEIFKAAERGNMIASEWTQWLKSVSKAEMKRVQSCLDQLTNMVLEGCDEGFKTILESHDVSNSESSTTAIAEAVRELVEYEVYVPLRRVLSKLLVNAFSNDDSQIYYRIEKLKNKSQSYFKILPELESSSNWESVSMLIKEGVGRSTLPCVKLRAILEAAKEIIRLFEEEHNTGVEEPQDISIDKLPDDSDSKSVLHPRQGSLSADDFLPIFIFCIVRSKLDRPCALMALLGSLCDPSKQLGETGYYLASFEAAVVHIQEVDLDEA